VRAQAGLHGAQEQPQGDAVEVGIAFQEVAQPFWHREDPLPHRQVRHDVIGEMRRGRHHAPVVARWAHAAPLAQERDQEVVAALRRGKAMRKEAAFQVTAELPHRMRRHRPGIVVALVAGGEPGLERCVL